ncbi:Ras-related protein Rab-31 [Sciurus carolinensis]|uniref:Ras-related protein Rab-31 n=1 Tax=Sciurus carolinensis TaxID=30640 RepID=A0AA41SRD2_SCICA|nr:Ras-related protein Rab-31 [Sciurus carolinensis]
MAIIHDPGTSLSTAPATQNFVHSDTREFTHEATVAQQSQVQGPLTVPGSREVPLKDAKEYAESIGAIVVETSAKNAINIEELFQGISRQIPPLEPHENGNSGAIKLVKPSVQGGRRCC